MSNDNLANFAMRAEEKINSIQETVTHMTLMLGMLRGIIFSFQDELNQHQHDTLTKIDRSIQMLFYTDQFKAKE